MVKRTTTVLGAGLWMALIGVMTCGLGLLRGADGDQALTLDPKIRTGRLENGLTFFLRENRRPENRAALRLAVNAGSILEKDDQQGLAHFLEHMAFNGTEHFEKQALVDFLEGIGMRFGPDLNAYTSFDETVYMLEIPLDDRDVVEKSFLVLQDWARGLRLNAEEIDKERGVVLEEWRLGRGAQQRVSDQQIPVLFHGSQYAERLPIGKTNILASAPREAFARFYREWYRPDLMAVIVVGDMSLDRMETLVRRYFEPLRNPAEAPLRTTFPIPDHSETLFSIVTDPELPYTTLRIAYKRDAQEERTERDYRRMVVEGLTAAMINQRLDEKRQEADPPYLFAGVGEMNLSRSKDIFLMSAVVREGQYERGLEALLTEARRVQRDGFTEGELQRVKAETIRGYEQAFQERDKTESGAHADEYTRHFLDGEPVPGIEKELALARQFTGDIDLEDVNRMARRWFTPVNRIVLYSAPRKPELKVPSEQEIATVLQRAERAEVEAYADEVSDAPLLPEPPAPGSIVRETAYEKIDVTQWDLSNGVQVYLKPTDFKNDQVLVRGFSPGGYSLVEDRDFIPATTATTLIAQSGVGDFDLIQLQKKLAGKIARATASISQTQEGVSGFGSPQDIETLFELIYLRFTAPRADAKTFASIQTRMRETIRNRENDPESVFGDRIQRVLYQDHPRHQPLSEATLAGMDPEASLRVYRDRFQNPGDFTFVIVGNFDLPGIRPLVEKYLGGLPGSGPSERSRFNGDDPLRGRQELVVEKGIEPKSTVQILFTGDTEWRDEARYARQLAVGVVRIRLREELREDRGGVYGVGVSGGLGRWPKGTYSCGIEFGCDPERVDSLTEAALAEVKRLAEEGPREVDLDKVKEQQLRAFEKGLKENPFWLNNLGFRVQNGLELEALLDYPERIKAMTQEDAARAARDYFSFENLFTAALRPEIESDVKPLK